MSDEGPPRPIVVSARIAEELMKHPDLIPPWSERIPAAIKHAKEHLDTGEHVSNGCKLSITTGEAALAEALWEVKEGFITMGGDPPPSHMAFAEKVEKPA